YLLVLGLRRGRCRTIPPRRGRGGRGVSGRRQYLALGAELEDTHRSGAAGIDHAIVLLLVVIQGQDRTIDPLIPDNLGVFPLGILDPDVAVTDDLLHLDRLLIFVSFAERDLVVQGHLHRVTGEMTVVLFGA